MHVADLWEDAGRAFAPEIDPTLLDGLDLTDLEAFRNSLQRVPRTQIKALDQFLDDQRRAHERPTDHWKELYHGAPQSALEAIMRDGFALTKGRRGGFLGAVHEVQNHGIFLTDSKAMAHYFGSNRSDYDHDYKVLTCFADVSHILDIDDVPRPLVRLGLKLVNDYNGSKLRKIPDREWWWLLDVAEFVDAVRALGYTGVRFRESKIIRREAGDDAAQTYMIFDPHSIRIRGKLPFSTFRDKFEWLQRQAGHGALSRP